jgi:hypothetical protein
MESEKENENQFQREQVCPQHSQEGRRAIFKKMKKEQLKKEQGNEICCTT